ncbi:MAG: ABC transporter permease [Myxococcales bacterium]|nr:ABC transporter permease [Myxococcales bacterium]
MNDERTTLGDLQRFFRAQLAALRTFVAHVGMGGRLFARTVKTAFTQRFDGKAYLQQLDAMGVQSMNIAVATAIFVAIVMTLQFGIFAERYGAKLALPRSIGVAEARELAPALTSLIVGCRISAGMAAELGSMAVTEQIDAIRALGADPVRRLVVPRVAAAMTIMPLISVFAFVIGMASALGIAWTTFGIEPVTFVNAALQAVSLSDFLQGLAKTPFFGMLVGVVGCHFGMGTRGGTVGVGKATTQTVVAAAITVLVADAILTQLFVTAE